ncbi:hypothetical protein JW826_01910 [Candidatus Woesearchaeota archaeon]|nr:hypothetical protein [Candidatus Woesearchaeota archaeon]
MRRSTVGMVIREDHGFYINALSGFPGPYGNYFERTVPSKKMLDMMKGCKDRRAHFVLAAAVAFPGGKVKEFVHKVHIEISESIKGGKGNWDDIMRLPGAKKTFSQTPDDEWTLYWTKNFEEIARYLEGKKIWR